jgi:BirA family transcriptional regulator, biotin operon repressor / biotin---[acetyl-CoA-carboxylase] ligase
MSRPADLLPLLSALKSSAVSGERLARQLKMTRTAVWKQIRALEKMGFPISPRKRRGYALAGTPDFSLCALKFKGALRHWAKPHYELSAPSTQRLALQAAQGGIPEGHFWIAETQSAGRGRLERPWSSGFGGLWFSLVLRPQVPPSRAASIGLVAALEWVRAIEKKTKIKARLKWPNDILIPSPDLRSVQGEGQPFKKVAGFLTQMSGEIDKTDWIVLGMGINVFNRIPSDLKDRATSLGQSGALPCDRAQLLTEFLRGFYASYRLWQRHGFAAFQADYWAHYARPNEPCVLKAASGDIRGIARGVDPTGAILIESQRKMRAVLEGEIVL